MGNQIRFGRRGLRAGLAAAIIIGPFPGLARAGDRDRDPESRPTNVQGSGWRYYRPDIFYSAPPVIFPPMGSIQLSGEHSTPAANSAATEGDRP